MGVDIYLRHKGVEHTPWGSGASTGKDGYLREAHFGGPYASMILVPEAFAAEQFGVPIPAATLRARLPETLRIAEVRIRRVYGVTDPNDVDKLLQEYRDFVELCGQIEQETGKPTTVIVSE